jgi:hypothetical protein
MIDDGAQLEIDETIYNPSNGDDDDYSDHCIASYSS